MFLKRQLKKKNAPLSIATEKRRAIDWHWAKKELIIEVAEEHHTDHKKYELDLPGVYQTKNLLTVLEACSQLQQLGWKIDDKIIHQGLKQTKKLTGLHGRWEIIHTSPQVVLDVAHNADGIRQLVLQIEVTSHRELHIVFGSVKDKDVEKVLPLLPKNATYYFTKAQIPRALPEKELLEKAKQAGLTGKTFSEVNAALQAAIQHAHADDLIIVCGSVFLVGEVQQSLF